MEVILREHPNLCMKQKNQKKEKNRRGRAHKVRKKIESFSPCFHFFIHTKKKMTIRKYQIVVKVVKGYRRKNIIAIQLGTQTKNQYNDQLGLATSRKLLFH